MTHAEGIAARAARAAGYSDGYDAGYGDGRKDGYDEGRAAGYAEGIVAAENEYPPPPAPEKTPTPPPAPKKTPTPPEKTCTPRFMVTSPPAPTPRRPAKDRYRK